jgi:tRNA modification GTPase
MLLDDTIAAVSTALGEGAIAVLRVSGPEARVIGKQLFRGKNLTKATPRMAYYGSFVDPSGTVLDQGLATVFAGPASYTGEDLVEFSCHGGVLVTRTLYETLLQLGCRPADPGEFTQRAFLNGKMDLTQAEAVMDLIQAQTSLALRAANEQLRGDLGQETMALRETLIGVAAHTEAYIGRHRSRHGPRHHRTSHGRDRTLASLARERGSRAHPARRRARRHLRRTQRRQIQFTQCLVRLRTCHRQ